MLEINRIDTIVWDFDGVLNRNVVDGKNLWMAGFEDEFGHSIEIFTEMVFRDDFLKAISEQGGLIELVKDWAGTVGYNGDLMTVIEFWFHNDYYLDDKIMGWLAAAKRANIRNVMGTNNEPMRTQFIAEDLGFADRMDRIFSSGWMGVAKPDEDYFDQISDELSVEPDELLLIDDMEENIEAAAACGWQVHLFDGKDYDALEVKLRSVGALG